MAAAVTDATGVVIRDLPLTPERVWRHIQEDNSRASGPVGGNGYIDRPFTILGLTS
ncbi:MAG: hypothetical protein ABSB01_27465 [Streptosporangiaceae bacterium]